MKKKKFVFILGAISLLVWGIGCDSSGKVSDSKENPSAVKMKAEMKKTVVDQCEIKLDKNKVIIQSNRLKMIMEGGIVTVLDDRLTGESFIRRTADAPLIDLNFQKEALLPDSTSVIPVMQNVSKHEAVITYTLKSGSVLIYEIRAEGDDILIRQRVKGYNMMEKENKKNLEIPIPFMVPASVITGKGCKTLRQEPKHEENLYWSGAGFPRVVMAEGEKSTLMFFCESTLPYHNIRFAHTLETDQLRLLSAENNLTRRMGRPLQFKNGDLDGFTWRISAHENWLEAARSWRTHFERYSGAVPLWKNPSETVRNTHAYFTGSPNTGGSWRQDPDAYYQILAGKFRPDGIVLLYWNADTFVMLGDSTCRLSPYPAPSVVTSLKKHGFKWMGFHGYTLLWSCEKKMQERIGDLKKRKLMPENYVYTPDWDGKPEDFLPTMAKFGFNRPNQVWSRVTPGSKIVQDYLCRSIQHRAKLYGMDGFYLDITGTMTQLTSDILVVDGQTYNDGDITVFSRLRKEAPHLALMTEYAGEWVIPYAFWHWDGYQAIENPGLRINHPLRAALYGSYAWARETSTHIDPVKCEYYGTLPEIVWGIGVKHIEDDLTDKWFIERAKMFVDNRLFHDLPEKWDDGAVAYYRMDGTDKWVVFRKTPYGYAFFKDDQVQLGIYKNTARGIPGFTIPYWLAYDRKGTAIGLNPAREYRFIAEKEDRPMTITSMPENVYCDAVHNTEYETTVLFDSQTAKTFETTVSFGKTPAKVYVNGEEQKTGKTTFQVALPGSLTVIWKEDKPVSFRDLNNMNSSRLEFFRKGFRAEKLDVNGLRGSFGYRGWASNMSDSVGPFAIDKERKMSIGVGAGRFQAFRECYVDIPSETPILKFDLAMLSRMKKIKMEAKLRINGKVVWQEDIPILLEWSLRQVDLSAYAGQRVLLSFEYGHKNADRTDSVARERKNMLYYGNPHFAPADGSGTSAH